MRLEKKMFVSNFEMQVLSGPRCRSMEYKDSSTFEHFDPVSNFTPLKPLAVLPPAPFEDPSPSSSAEHAKIYFRLGRGLLKLEKNVFVSSFELQVLSGPRFLSIE